MFKKLLALILALLMIGSCLAGCSQNADNSADTAALQQQINDLKVLVEDLNDRINLLEMGSIAQWALTAEPLIQGSGASVTLYAAPAKYQEGQVAQFRVLLEGSVAAELYCDWNGEAYSASVELDAADGYSYYLILTDPSGKQEQKDLCSPANPTHPELVNMYTSLSAGCSLEIYESKVTNSTLELTAGTIGIQLPTLTAGGQEARCTGIHLILQLDGTEIQRQDLTPAPEAPQIQGSMELSSISFSIPELEESSQLDLWLEVTLSDGQVLSAFASSWYYADGELIQAVG